MFCLDGWPLATAGAPIIEAVAVQVHGQNSSVHRDIVADGGSCDDIDRPGPRGCSLEEVVGLMLDECPTPIIAKAVRSHEWLERLAIATHPKAPANTLKILCNDGNKWVRQAAKRAVENREKAA